MVTLKGSRFILRPFKKGDEKSLKESVNDKEIARNTSTIPYPYTAKDAAYWVNRCRTNARKKPVTSIALALVIDKEVVGSVGLHHIKDHEAEIGYWLARKYWGQGIMPEAAKLVTDYAFTKLKLKRIYGCVFPFNKKSAHVLTKIGFRYEGISRKAVLKNGKYLDEKIFALVK